MNTHGQPDVLHELMAREGDLLPATVLSTTWPVVPASSLTLAPFPTRAYVRAGADLVYVDQPAASVTLSGADGNYWLGVHRDTSTAVASWTRVPGTHYLWRTSAPDPPDPPGGLVLAKVTVAGSVITAVDVTQTSSPYSRVAFGGPSGALAYDPAFVWDAGLNRLGIGIPTPGARLSLGTDLPANGQTLLLYEAGFQKMGFGVLGSGEMRTLVPSNGALTFGALSVVDGFAFTEHLRYDAVNGRLGMGTTAPAARLSLGADLPANAQTLLLYQAGFQRMGFGMATGEMRVLVASNGVLTFGALSTADGFGYTEHMRYDAINGRFGLGTPAPQHQLHLTGTLGLPGGTAGIVNTTSTRALKQAVRPLTGALATLLRLRERQWEWAQPALAQLLPGTQTGFVVEELAEDKPEWVRLAPDGTAGYSEAGSLALVVGALRELTARLGALEAAVAPPAAS